MSDNIRNLTLDEAREILTSRGVQIEDLPTAEDVLYSIDKEGIIECELTSDALMSRLSGF